jgi:DNA repair exonuclease SbcCD ATPase subunit
MNKERRAALSKIQDELTAKGQELEAFLSTWHGEASALKDELEAIKDAEEEYRDNMPENMQNSERYSNADEAVSALDDALSEFDEKLGELEPFSQDDNPLSGIFDHIENAKGQA